MIHDGGGAESSEKNIQQLSRKTVTVPGTPVLLDFQVNHIFHRSICCMPPMSTGVEFETKTARPLRPLRTPAPPPLPQIFRVLTSSTLFCLNQADLAGRKRSEGHRYRRQPSMSLLVLLHVPLIRKRQPTRMRSKLPMPRRKRLYPRPFSRSNNYHARTRTPAPLDPKQ